MQVPHAGPRRGPAARLSSRLPPTAALPPAPPPSHPIVHAAQPCLAEHAAPVLLHPVRVLRALAHLIVLVGDAQAARRAGGAIGAGRRAPGGGAGASAGLLGRVRCSLHVWVVGQGTEGAVDHCGCGHAQHRQQRKAARGWRAAGRASGGRRPAGGAGSGGRATRASPKRGHCPIPRSPDTCYSTHKSGLGLQARGGGGSTHHRK